MEQKPGVECIIHSLGSDEKVAQRLAQMGVLPGLTLQIIRIASFGTTVEVSIDGSQSFAIRKDELTASNCQVVAMPLTCSDVQLHMTYRIRTLSGGRKFQQRMEAQGIQLKKRE
ncbi:MAG: ferrous iron transport protein A [Proteobacteria bacterium]|nr:ferrous iron transport protein A [Pseudomonadota bacterium]